MITHGAIFGETSDKSTGNRIFFNGFIITPPFALRKSKISKEITYSCFISTKEKNEKASYKRTSQIMAIFKDYNFNLIK